MQAKSSRATVPLLLLILITLLGLVLARVDAASPPPDGPAAALDAAGGRLAYRQADGTVWIMDPDGGRRWLLGTGRSLTWSPDGRHLVIGTQVRRDLETGQARALRSSSGAIPFDRAQWVAGSDRLLLYSPDETGLYLSRTDAREASFSLADAADLVPLAADGAVGFHAGQFISPDGERLAFVRRSPDDLLASVWIKTLDSGDEVELALPRPPEVVRDYVYDLAWDPAGRQLVFSWATAEDTDTGPPTRIQLMRAVPGEVQPQVLVPAAAGTYASHPVWSPDGDAIAYAQTHIEADLTPRVSIHVLDPSAGVHFLLVGLPAGDVLTSFLAWSPDGQVLYFSARDRRSGESVLYLAARDGGVRRIVGDLYSLGWLPYEGEVAVSGPMEPLEDGGLAAAGDAPAGSDVQVQVAYDRAAAMDYALSRCSEATPNCPVGLSYAEVGGDCAHFVSHGLLAGGLSNYNSIGLGHNPSGTSWYVYGGIIIRAQNEHDWVLGGGRGAARTSAQQLDRGDVMAYDWDGANGWNHVTMVVQNDGRGDVRIASHTRYGCDLDWSMGGAARYEYMHILAAPAAPTHPSPAAGDTVTDTAPLLEWSARGTSHQVQLSLDAAFALVLFDASGLGSPAYPVAGPLPEGTYYWRARTSDGYGTSPWSETWHFVRQDPCPLPPAPAPLTPAEGEVLCAGTPVTLTWTAVPTATTYVVEWVSAEPLTRTYTVPDASLALTATLAPGTHTWRVRGVNDCGPGPWSVPPWSAPHSFAVVNPVPAPALNAPPDGALTADVTPAFRWSAVTGAVSYTLQLASSPAFAPLTLQARTATPAYTPTAPLDLGGYVWRVRSENVCGGGDWSAPRSFHLVEALLVHLPLLLGSPSCGEALQNGGFEADSFWSLGGARPPTYTTDRAHGGARSLRHGTVPGLLDLAASSSASQQVTLPADVSAAALTFWVWRGTEDGSGDLQQALLLEGSTARVEEVLLDGLAADNGWTPFGFDLAAYRGQTVQVYFNVTNDGDGARTWMYVDDVSLAICP